MTATSIVKPPQRRDMKIEQWPTDKLEPYGKNPRKNADAVAAEQTGRHAFLMEIDELYCDVIVNRWEAFTGKKADRRQNHG